MQGRYRMQGIYQKRQQFRREIRKRQMEVFFKNQRNKLTVQDQQASMKTAQIGLEQLRDIAERNEDREDIKRLQQEYPIQRLQPFLDSAYDRSEIQYLALMAMENYFYVGYKERPSQQLMDRILRVLQVDKVDSMKVVLLILCDILSDHYKYNLFLITKKAIVPKLLHIFETYVNNTQIKRVLFKLIQQLVENADWHDDIRLLVKPLLNMVSEANPNQVIAILQTLYNAIQIKPALFQSLLYQKQIHSSCFAIMCKDQSRVATFLYLKFIAILEGQLKQKDVQQVLLAIAFIRQRNYRVGDGMAKYSSSQIQLSVYGTINSFIRSQDHNVSAMAMSYMEAGMLKELKQEVDRTADQSMLFALAQVLFAVCLRSEGKHDFTDIAMKKCQFIRRAAELEREYEYIKLNQSCPQQMEIEQV